MGRIKLSVSQPKDARIKTTENAKPSPNQLRPKFSLEHLQKSHCLSLCEKDEKAALADRLHQMSQLTWQQIQQADRHGQGSETIARTSLKVTVPSAITEDTPILSFRFCGKAPMVGFRQEEVFYVVWLDRAFDVYNH
jgi:hypothetical protein